MRGCTRSRAIVRVITEVNAVKGDAGGEGTEGEGGHRGEFIYHRDTENTEFRHGMENGSEFPYFGFFRSSVNSVSLW
jgi:hypothetical protein